MKKIQFFFLAAICLTLITSCGDDDDGGGTPSFPNVSIGDVETVESNADKTVSLTINVFGTSDGTSAIEYSTVDGTAVAGEDYESAAGTITIGAGETSKTIEINIKGDDLTETDEQFEIQLSNPVNAGFIDSKAVVTIVNDDSPTGSIFDIPTTGYTTPLSYTNYDLVWNDEFQGDVLDEGCWNYEIGNGSGGWGNNELEYYKKENTVIVDNEYLVIQAKQESQSGFDYTSSRLTTQGKKSFQYGRIDIRAAMPQGKGLWPALWMLGENFSTAGWPACGEIDIMEMVGGSATNDETHGTVHWDNAGSYASYGNAYSLSSGILADEFHVYSIVWDATKIVWYIDDVQYNIISTTPDDLSEFRAPFFFIFNVAVGGNWPGSPDASTVFPQRMAVDYIRVFQ